MKRMLLFLCFLTTSLLHGEGFIAGTYVKTPNGYTPIEELKVDDTVICFNLEGSCVERKITHTYQESVTRFFILSVNNQEIIVADDHKFYMPLEKKWLTAHELKTGHLLLKNCLEFVAIDQIREIPTHDTAYTITVDRYHSFCVSQEDIVVHNAIPLLAQGANLASALRQAIKAGTLASIHVKDNLSYEEFSDLYDLSIPAKPTEKDGFIPPKKWEGQKVRHPETGQYGWPDKGGRIWVPSGPYGHGGPHWDVVDEDGEHINVLPGGKIRGDDE